MALTIPTEIHKGPWILKQSDFEELERVIIETEKYLKEAVEFEIIDSLEKETIKENLTEEEKQKWLKDIKERRSFKKVKKVTLFSEDGKRLTGSSIREILRDSSLDTVKPSAFNVFIEYGYSNNVKLDISNDKLKLDINCFDQSKSNDIRLDLNNWINKVKPKQKIRIWNNLGGFLILGLITPILFLAYFSFKTDYSTYHSDIKEEAKKLLDHKIDSSNINKAVEYILKLETDYVPKDFVPQKVPNDPANLRWLSIALFFWIISILRPVTVFGFGKRKWLIDFYKWWIPFVTITVPAVLIVGPCWDYIKQFLRIG